MAELGIAKRLGKGIVSTKDNRVFKVPRSGGSEEEIRLDFGREVKYQVVKLSLRGLPRTDGKGKKITWVTNFAVRGQSGRYPQRVRYVMFLKKHAGKTFFYHDHRGLRWDKRPQPQKVKGMPRAWVKVTFTSADPAAGWG